MATRTKKPAAKRSGVVAKRTATGRTATPVVSAKAAGLLGADSILQVAKALEKVRLRAAANKLLASRRRDLEAIVSANRQSVAGIQAVVKKQSELLKASIGEWRSVAKVMSVAGPRESIARLDELAKQAFRISLANVRELAELSVKTQAEAFDLVKDRIRRIFPRPSVPPQTAHKGNYCDSSPYPSASCSHQVARRMALHGGKS